MSMNTKSLKPHPAKCSWCDMDFVINERSKYGALLAGRNVYCSQSCRKSMNARRQRERAGKHFLGPCPQCGKMFNSKRKDKIFCTLDCYTSHPSTIERLREANESKKIDDTACPQCGKLKTHKRRYCSKICQRQYYSERFDRWIANPEKLSLPQNFDEYLSSNTLPCLVEGCDWEGEHLGSHVNRVHGITADEFREIAGFNRKTGLVGASLSRAISERFKEMIEKGIIEANPPETTHYPAGSPTAKRTLEGEEHRKKAMAIRKMSGVRPPPRPCVYCGKDVEQPWTGSQKYCNTMCRSAHYTQTKVAELLCSYCGAPFAANRDQLKRHRNGSQICCSSDCRNKMNIIACLAARGIEWSPS